MIFEGVWYRSRQFDFVRLRLFVEVDPDTRAGHTVRRLSFVDVRHLDGLVVRV